MSWFFSLAVTIGNDFSIYLVNAFLSIPLVGFISTPSSAGWWPLFFNL
jgi:hypothetical protein